MGAFMVEDAVREKLFMSVALIGASGSGKTLSALLLAKGVIRSKYPELSENSPEFWAKIGVVDTEHRRSRLYADTSLTGEFIGRFKTIDFTEPYTTDRYREAVEALIKIGVEVIIIDSLSHAWEGEGGILELQQSLGGRYQDWKTVKPFIRDFYRTLTEKDVHIISTIRTKQEYQVDTSATGQLKVTKLGLKPIQKDDIEFELQIAWSMDMEHVATATKDNSGLFDGNPKRLSVEDGGAIYAWVEEGKDMSEEKEKQRLVYVDKMRVYVENPNVLVQDKVSRYVAHAKTKFGVSDDFTTYPIGVLKPMVDALERVL